MIGFGLPVSGARRGCEVGIRSAAKKAAAPVAVKSIWDEFPHDLPPAEQEQWFADRLADIGEERENTYWRLDQLAEAVTRYQAERAGIEARIAEIDEVIATVEQTIAEYRQHMEDLDAREMQLANWAAARGMSV